jgi:hypothetical protein
MRSTLEPIYGLGVWSDAAFAENLPPPLEQATTGGPTGSVLGGGEWGRPWADLVIAGLGSIPRGLAFRARATPPQQPPPPLLEEERAVDPPSPSVLQRRAQPTESERRVRDEEVARVRAPIWSVALTLHGSSSRCFREPMRRFSRLITFSSHSQGGARLTFHPRDRWHSFRASPSFLGEGELAELFPTPWTRLSGRGTPAGGGGSYKGRADVLPPIPPHEGRHLLVLGETGMGKSSLLVELALRASALGTVVFFDPVGDVGRRFLEALPISDERRVSWVSPFDSPVAWNALEAVSVRGNDLVGERALGDLVLGLRRVRSSRFADSSFWGPRIEEVLIQALRAASLWPQGTLETAEALLGRAGGHIGPIPPEATEAVSELRSRVRDRPEDVEGARRLLGEVGRLRVLRRLLATPSKGWSLAEAVQPGQITVITGDAPEVGEYVSRYLLAVYLALLWPAILSRRGTPKTFVILDELQWYGHDGLGEMLRLGRRFNLHLYGATQSLRPLSAELRDSWLTNAADIALFRGSPEEALEFGRWNPELSSERLMALGRGEAILFRGKGHELLSLRIRALPSSADSVGRFDRLRQKLRPLWGLEGDLQDPERSDGPTGDEPALAESEPVAILRTIASRGSQDEVVRVDLDRLRQKFPGWEARVGEVGREMSRLGVLLNSGRDAEGRFWILKAGTWPEANESRPGAGSSQGSAAEADRWTSAGLVGIRRQSF